MCTWFCNICDKTIKFLSKPKHITSNSNKHEKNIKLYEFDNRDKNGIFFIINNCDRDCYNDFFHKFKFICIYDIEMTNGYFVNGKIFDKEFKKYSKKLFYT